jgi:hypothetical protein
MELSIFLNVFAYTKKELELLPQNFEIARRTVFYMKVSIFQSCKSARVAVRSAHAITLSKRVEVTINKKPV